MLLALFVRVVVCAVLGPLGNDDHYEVIAFILREHRLPTAEMFAQSFHPPLYHLLATPFAAIGGPRAVEVLSLVLSVANAWLLVRLVREHTTGAARLHALLLIALLPSLVLFSIVVSNDGLAMLLGTIAIFVTLQFVREPAPKTAALAGVVAGVGLLAKGTLLTHVLVMLAIIAAFAWRQRSPRLLLIFVMLAVVLGSYKFVENQIVLGRPVVHNMDFSPGWVRAQRPTVTGPASWLDVNLAKLWREPYAEHADGTWTNPRSVPLLLYATFWHPYVPVSNFRAVFRYAPWIGKLTYIAALLPTLLILIGLRRNLLLAAFLAASVALVVAVGVRYDAWSCFQARLFFPAFASIALAYAWGIEDVLRRWPRAATAIHVWGGALYLLFVTYYGVEITSVVRDYAARHW